MRPKKAIVDYFPHYVNHGKTMFTVENKYGNNGYAFCFKLYELLGCSEHHYIDCNDSETWEFLLAKTRLNEDIATDILNLLAKLNSINPELWGIKVIRSDNYIENLEAVYRRRTLNVISNEELMSLCIQKHHLKRVTVNKKPQSIVKESIVEESKVNDIAYPWDDERFLQIWEFWKKYKKEQFRETYKSIGEQAALSHLSNLAGGKLETAMLIIKQSIENTWKGLFELKGKYANQNQTYNIDEITNNIRQRTGKI